MYKVHQQYTPYERFEGVLKSKFTKITYLKSLKHFLEFSRLENYTDLITKLSDEEKHNLVSDYLMYIKNNKKLSTSTILVAYSTVKKFYSVNRVRLDWDHLKHFKESGRKRRIEDRLYTKEEIDQMLIHADLRDKVVIYTLLSTGMRVGGLAGIQIKDMEYIEQYKLYKFMVYANDQDSIEERYVTYCTPECAEIIKKYLKYREMQGDTIKPNSPLIYRKVMRYDMKKKQSVMINQFDEPLDNISVSVIVMRLQRKSAVLPKEVQTEENIGKIRKPIMRCHAFRKMFNTICIRNNVNHTIKEKLMGHKTGLQLDYSYYRPNNEKNELLQEYLKVVDELTIKDEYRLQKQVQELKKQDDYQKYVIDKKIKEKDEEIAKMRQAMRTVLDTVDEMRNDFIAKQNEKVEKDKKIENDFNRIESRLFETQMLALKLDEVDQKRQEMYVKKGFVTKEDEEAIKNSIIEDVKQNDPDLWHLLFDEKQKQEQEQQCPQ